VLALRVNAEAKNLAKEHPAMGIGSWCIVEVSHFLALQEFVWVASCPLDASDRRLGHGRRGFLGICVSWRRIVGRTPTAKRVHLRIAR